MRCVQREEPEFYEEQLHPAMAPVQDVHAQCLQVDDSNEAFTAAL